MNKKTLELDDITKAISALQQAGEMPLVLATICQMTKCPQSWGVPQAPTNQDVIGKIAMLEKQAAMPQRICMAPMIMAALDL